MEQKNNFQELQEEQETIFKVSTDKVKNSLDANLGGIRMITDIFELYFSKVLDYFIKATGGETKDEGNKK